VALRTRVKADQECASVAAASVIAKVHRDHLMIEADATTPGYLWSENKGYGSAAHFAAIAQRGATDFHRRSWLRHPELLESALL
jgi:ribonuclease HII